MQLLAPQWLMTLHNTLEVLEDHAVLVHEGHIHAIGPKAELQQQHPQARVVELPGQLMMPGLINGHSHAAMNLLRGAADDLPLHDWLQKRIWPLEGALADGEFVYDGTALACAEMLQNGITTTNEMYFYPHEAAQAALDLGQRMVVGITVIEFPTRYANTTEEYISKGLAARDAHRDASTLHWSLAPHAPYTVSDDTFVRLAALAEDLNLPLHCHIHETASEVSDGVSRHGVRPFERLDRLGVVNQRLLAVHGVHLNTQELERMAQVGASLVHCPSSNLKLASGFAPTQQALQLGVKVLVGTDGAASNNKLDLWEEGRLASLLAKGHSQDATAWPAGQLLLSMTLHAAQALGLAHKVGSIAVGKCADLISLSVQDHAHQVPIHNWVSKLAYSGGGRDVQNVWVEGKQVVQAQQLVGPQSEIISQIMRKTQRVWQTGIREFGPV